MTTPELGTLPRPIVDLLTGDDLPLHVGETFVLCACETGEVPRVALLSVGEVLAASGSELRFVLYAGSGTTRAVTSSGRALLVLVCEGVTYKIGLSMTPRALPDVAGKGYRGFTGTVSECRRDEVGYAHVLHGIEYELADPEPTIARWEGQLEWLRS
jgi:hypothetical protein